MTTLASARERNHSTLRHSSRSLPLKLSLVAVLPGLARIDQRRGDAALGDPLEDCAADELRAVVRAQEERRAVRADEAREHLDHALGADRAGHVDGQALAGELVDDRQALDLLAVGAGVEDEVVGPDEVRGGRRQRTRAAAGDAPPRSATRQLQPGLAPQPVRSVPAELMPLALQEDADAPVAVARVLRRQRLHRFDHRCVLRRQAQLVAQRGTRDRGARHSSCPVERQA